MKRKITMPRPGSPSDGVTAGTADPAAAEAAGLGARLVAVRDRILAACARAGRAPQDVRLVAVSKTFPAGAVRAALAAGQHVFGENYVQEAVEKITALTASASPPIEWHFIGPLQSNKTRQVAEHFDWVHTVDRLKIAQRLSEQRPAHLPALNICLQVNVSGEASKSGVMPAEALALAQAIAALPRLKLRGLMSIPEPVADMDAPERAAQRLAAQRAPHRALRFLFDRLNRSGQALDTPLDTLSMGMSADLEAAILEGATMVRIGSAIFGERNYPT